MHEPAKQTPSKLRQVKLRASCDTCFLAKVKCSKARPICSRCLACGAECKYSPSCRAGKRKSGVCKIDRYIVAEGNSIRDATHRITHATDSNRGTHRSRVPQEAWSTPRTMFGSPEEVFELEISSSITSLPIAQESCLETEGSGANEDFFSPLFGWVSRTQTDNTSTYLYNVARSHPNQLSALSNQHFNSSWVNQKNYATFPSPPPELVSSPIVNPSDGSEQASSCRCFNRCLEILQKLYECEDGNGSATLDALLNVNQEAIATCSTILGCLRCTSGQFSELQAMVLVTIISRILPTHQITWNNYCG